MLFCFKNTNLLEKVTNLSVTHGQPQKLFQRADKYPVSASDYICVIIPIRCVVLCCVELHGFPLLLTKINIISDHSARKPDTAVNELDSSKAGGVG